MADISKNNWKANAMSNSQGEFSPKVYITRHCKTLFNAEYRLQGTINVPLSDEGVKQAEANIKFVENLGINIIISSPLKRAYQTAEIYADYLNIPVIADERLRELDHGDWEGLTFDDLLNKSSYSRWIENPTKVLIPGSTESIVNAQKRVILGVKENVKKHKAKIILFMMHKHIRAILLCGLKNKGLENFKSQIEEDIGPSPVTADRIQRILEYTST